MLLKFMQGIIVQNFTHLNKWSIIIRRMMVLNAGVIASFVVTANMHQSTHVTTSLILIYR